MTMLYLPDSTEKIFSDLIIEYLDTLDFTTLTNENIAFEQFINHLTEQLESLRIVNTLPESDLIAALLYIAKHISRQPNILISQKLVSNLPSILAPLISQKALQTTTQQYEACILPFAAAISLLGFAYYIFNATLTEVRERETFGKRLVDNQHIEFTLANLQAKLLAFEANVELCLENSLSAPMQLDTQLIHVQQLDLLGGTLTTELADTFLQFSGGRGYIKGHPAEYCYRMAYQR